MKKKEKTRMLIRMEEKKWTNNGRKPKEYINTIGNAGNKNEPS